MNAVDRVKQAARRYAGAARRRVAAPAAREEREQRILFLFCGKSHAWRNPGRRLYRFEPLFREGIDASDALVREILGFSSTAAFSGEWLPAGWDEEVRSEIVTMALAQMGLADLWRATQQVEPGFLGLSGGEVAAAYGAGVLSREEAVRTICWIASCLRHPADRCMSFKIDAHGHKAQWLCRSAPRLLEFGGEIIPGVSQVRSESGHAAENRAFLEAHVPIIAEHSISYRYHVPAAGVDEESFAAALPFLSSKRSHAPLYLCSFGGRVPEGFEFGWKHWAWMVSSPYRMGAASAAACEDGFNRLIVAGSTTIGDWHVETTKRLRRPARAINVFAEGPDAVNPWPATIAQIDGSRLASAPARRRDKSEPVDLADPVHLADPYAAYEELRRRGPVHYLPRQDFWIVLGHSEMRAACSDPGTFSNQPYDYVDKALIARDPPDHAPIRRMIARHFDPATMRRLEAFAGTLARSLLKPRLDVVADYAAPFSHGIAAELIGLDPDGLAAVLEASEDARDEAEPFAALTRALDRLADRAAIYRRIREAGEGLVDDDEVRSLVRFLWLAAITTTERAISRSAMHLLEQEDVLRRVRSDRRLLAPFIEEVLRLTPPEHMLPRRVLRDTMLGGVAIPAGAEVQLCTTAANRDPAVFDDPAAFRLDRDPSHLSFGSGSHHCSGTALARRVIPIAVGALIDSPGLRAIQPPETIEFLKTVKTLVPKSFVIGT